MESRASIRRILANFLSRRVTPGAHVRAAVRDREIAQASLRRIENHLAQLVRDVSDYATFLRSALISELQANGGPAPA